MTFKNILVPLSGETERDVALEAALAVGKRFGARIEAFHAASTPQPLDPEWENLKKTGMGNLMLMRLREAEQRKTLVRQAFEEACGRHGVPIGEAGASAAGFYADFNVATGEEAELVPTRGRIADLIVAAQPNVAGDTSGSQTLEAVLMDSGRLVLVIPGEGKLDLEGVVGIGWNGRPEASRALSFALPFLSAAREAVVLEIDEAGTRRGLGGEEVVSHLTRHGVKARNLRVGRSGKSVGECLLAAARSADAGMLVMGGNAKSRLRHLIFGGVTQDVIVGTKIPVLMAH